MVAFRIKYMLQVFAVTAFAKRLQKPNKLSVVDPFLSPRNFFRRGDFDALTPLERCDELAGIEEGLMRAGIEPGKPPSHDLGVESTIFEIAPIAVRNLQFSQAGWFQAVSIFHNMMVVKIKAHDGID